jgi:hypothetical protein
LPKISKTEFTPEKPQIFRTVNRPQYPESHDYQWFFTCKARDETLLECAGKYGGDGWTLNDAGLPGGG